MLTNLGKIASCICAAYITFAAQVCNGQILIGPNVGSNWTIFSIDNLKRGTSTPILSTSVGAIGEFAFNGFLSIQLAPSYIREGSQWKNLPYGGPLPFNTEIRFQYFQIPIELKVKLPIPEVSPHILLGPTISYLLSTEVGPPPYQEDATEFYKPFVYSLDYGMGLEYNIAPFTYLNVDLKYSLGQMSVEKQNGIHVHGVQIFISVLFSI
jgi:hypothetical protein